MWLGRLLFITEKRFKSGGDEMSFFNSMLHLWLIGTFAAIVISISAFLFGQLFVKGATSNVE